jgi:hypothetical protein
MSKLIQLPAIPDDLALNHLHNADEFLRTRGLDRAGLDRLVRAKTGDSRHLLLTSSPVQGLANATSDLDFIRIQEEALDTSRMATQIFEDGQHLEVISFDVRETAAALADVTALAGADPAQVVRGHRGWDKSHELRRKYLERLINGVAMDGGSPYLDHLPELARIWKWSSLHTATEQVFFLGLAERAGETRGRAGYALGALLHLMDALLSQHGDVYSNRKWYLLRWRRFVGYGAAADIAAAGLVDLVEHLCRKVSAVLRGGSSEPLAPAVTELLDLTYRIAGEGHRPAVTIECDDRTPRLRFLPGAELLLGGTAVFLGTDPLPSGTVTPDTELPGDPGDLLRAARSGMLRLLPA